MYWLQFARYSSSNPFVFRLMVVVALHKPWPLQCSYLRHLFDLKKKNMEERLRQADLQQQQPQNKQGDDVLQQAPGNKRRALRTSIKRPTPVPMTELPYPTTPPKRPRVMTARFSNSDVQLNTLRKSLSSGQACA